VHAIALAPNGRLFVLVPNARCALAADRGADGADYSQYAVTPGEWEHGHRRTYSSIRWSATLREAGLRVVQRGGLLFKALANYQMDRALERVSSTCAISRGFISWVWCIPRLL